MTLAEITVGTLGTIEKFSENQMAPMANLNKGRELRYLLEDLVRDLAKLPDEIVVD